ncbi:MAG TPA: hypothetical protein DGZ24_05770 [Rhodospirillaceae bacterium]|nr:hypothetical protein [Rhodospirillaceae bacterium]
MRIPAVLLAVCHEIGIILTNYNFGADIAVFQENMLRTAKLVIKQHSACTCIETQEFVFLNYYFLNCLFGTVEEGVGQ